MVEPFLDSHVRLERRAAGNLEPGVHEDLAVRSVVIDIDACLAQVEDECSLSEGRGGQRTGQRRVANVNGFSRRPK